MSAINLDNYESTYDVVDIPIPPSKEVLFLAEVAYCRSFIEGLVPKKESESHEFIQRIGEEFGGGEWDGIDSKEVAHFVNQLIILGNQIGRSLVLTAVRRNLASKLNIIIGDPEELRVN